VERQNLTMRMSMRRFTPLTNALSKKVENHEHMLAIYFMYYNFCRVMIEDLVALLEPKSTLDGLDKSA
jgi:hypothetical protein